MTLDDHKEALSILFIGFVWGITNPFLRKGTEEAEEALQRANRKDDGGDVDDVERVITIVGPPQCSSSPMAGNTTANQNQIQAPPTKKSQWYKYCNLLRPKKTNSMSTSSSPGYEEISLTSDFFSYGSIGKDNKKNIGNRRQSDHSINSFFKDDEISLASLTIHHEHLHDKDLPSPTFSDITASEQEQQQGKKSSDTGRLGSFTAKLKLSQPPLTTSGDKHDLTEMVQHQPTPTETATILSLPSQPLEETETPKSEPTFLQGIIHTLLKFKNPSVFIPFLLNQTSGICYYKLIATTTLTNAAYCNALSMIFSALTGHFLGERLDRPMLACGGSFMVVLGVAICMTSKELQEELVKLFFDHEVGERGMDMGTGILGGEHNNTLNTSVVNISIATASASSSDYIGSDLNEAASGVLHTLLSLTSSLSTTPLSSFVEL